MNAIKLVRIPRITLYTIEDGYLIELNADEAEYQIAFTLSVEASELIMGYFALGKWERWKVRRLARFKHLFKK